LRRRNEPGASDIERSGLPLEALPFVLIIGTTRILRKPFI